MDWGLFRSKEQGKKYLRHKILYPSWFYYFAMVTNFILRFFWILGLVSDEHNFDKWVDDA
jgi:hypothetical protein